MKNSDWGERALARGLALFPGDADLEAWTKPAAFSTDTRENTKSFAGVRGADKTCLSVRFHALSYREFSGVPLAAGPLGVFTPAIKDEPQMAERCQGKRRPIMRIDRDRLLKHSQSFDIALSRYGMEHCEPP